MILIKRLTLCVALSSVFLVVQTLPLEATPSGSKGKGKIVKIQRLQRQVSRMQRKLKNSFLKLTPAQKSHYFETAKGDYLDSDEDGLPDDLEDDRFRCDDDADDDGLTDGEEYEDEKDPFDSDSDDDGVPDGDELEDFGEVLSVTSDLLELDSEDYVLTPDTKLIDYLGKRISLTDIKEGVCVEVEYHVGPAQELIADLVRKEPSCPDEDDLSDDEDDEADEFVKRK